MLKKILGLLLAVIIAVCPVASFAESEASLAENFNDGIVSSWTAEGGSAEFSSDDYGYLKFTADAAGAVLSRKLGIESGDFTVDFKIKAESETGTATVSVGGAELALDLDAKTLAGKSFIPKLWYDVRVVSDGSLYIDGVKVATVTVNFEDSFKITTAQACVIGIDDFKVYAENKTDELTSTPLDFKFDDFTFTNNATTPNSNPAPTITGDVTKFDDVAANWNSGTQGTTPVFGTNFSSAANIDIKTGVFGKSKSDSSAYLNHQESGYSSYSDSTLDFSIGEGGYLPNSGDKQVISFNFAFGSDVPEDLVIRTFNVYEDANGTPVYGGKAGASSAVTGADGQVMRIVGESMYLFGTKYYSIRPALLPNQWNNIRLELEVGDGAYNSTTTNNTAMKISAYVNDMVVAKDIEVKSNAYYVRDPKNNAGLRGCFNGVHRLQFNYHWGDERKTVNGIYLDDVKIENYYSGAKPEVIDSPLVWNEKGSLSLDRFAEPSSEGWIPYRNDKWVQGNTVYVDSERTLQDYQDGLIDDRNLGIIFRDVNGNEISDLTQKIGDLTYAEITRTDFSRIYVSLIGKTTELTEFALDGDETAFDTSWDANGVVNNNPGAWDGDGDSSTWGADGGDDNAVTSQSAISGKADGDGVLKIAAASDGSEKKTKFAFFRKNGDVPTSGTPSVYTKADYFRPMTFEGSVLIPSEGSSLNIKTVNMIGSRKSYVYGKGSTQTNHNDYLYSLIHFKDGYITARKPYGEDGALELGQYNVGEWNRIAFTVYPGYGRYRIDVSVNGGENVEDYIYISTGGNIMHQATTWLMLNTVGDVYIDDFKATAGYYDHNADRTVKVSIPEESKGVIDQLSADTFLAASGESVTNVKTALGTGRIYADNTYASEKEGNVATGDKLVVQNGPILKYFTINTNNFVKDGDTIKALARNVGDRLYVGLYTDAAATELDSIAKASATAKGIFSATIDSLEGIEKIKGFLWNSNLVPYFASEAVE